MEKSQSTTRQPLKGSVADFTDLETWKFARRLRSAIYQAASRFPADEKFGLAAQMKRAAISVTANLAEGYGRYSYQENIQFCRQSRGSLYELRDHLTTALDGGYISKTTYDELDATCMSTIRLVNGYIRATKKRRDSARSGGES